MSTRPGMADGRALGLVPYLEAGNLNSQLMRYLGTNDNASYREALTTHGKDISREFFRTSTASVDAVDQGCCGTEAVRAPFPANYAS